MPLALQAGTRLGPYEVLAALGAGGMGEVYKARDSRLDRLVAVKILSPALAMSGDARERFESEARANHDSHITVSTRSTTSDVRATPYIS